MKEEGFEGDRLVESIGARLLARLWVIGRLLVLLLIGAWCAGGDSLTAGAVKTLGAWLVQRDQL